MTRRHTNTRWYCPKEQYIQTPERQQIRRQVIAEARKHDRPGHIYEKYTISGHQEETYCHYCATPLYNGDTAYILDDGDVFCSRTCANSAIDHDPDRYPGG